MDRANTAGIGLTGTTGRPCAMFDASVPVLLHYLARLAAMIEIAKSNVHARGVSEETLLAARLAPDMLPLSSQIEIAVNFALRTCFPLAGRKVPPFGEFLPTFAGLHARIARASALLAALNEADFAGAERRVIDTRAGEAELSLPAPAFLYQYAIPNFFFHVTTAFAILRQSGIPLGKGDFDGFHVYARRP